MTSRDPLIPPWEMCQTCGGDHWTKDHRPLPLGLLKFELVFSKADNPMLSDDLRVRRGVACTKLSAGIDPKALDWDAILEAEVQGAMRAALHRLREEGYVE